MKEVEVKAHIQNKDSVMSTLTAQGWSFSAPKRQEDTVYVRETGSIPVYLANHDFLRLRKEENGTVLLTLKHHIGRADNPNSAPHEYETTVGSREEIERMLLTLGFKEAVRINKVRVKAKKDTWEICVDEVEGLGSFIEIEEMTAVEDITAIQKSMTDFLSTLGISGESSNLERYDILLLRKAGW
jgi:adenylate cyclase, class 2